MEDHTMAITATKVAAAIDTLRHSAARRASSDEGCLRSLAISVALDADSHAQAVRFLERCGFCTHNDIEQLNQAARTAGASVIGWEV